jgi:predicted unusual protein kinase regulating ubiquinone biosynthesis (AarF/ABC1/UbiB family)
MLAFFLVGLLAFALITVAMPSTRRIWAFGLYGWKYLLLFVLDFVGWRRLWAYLMNKPYLKLTGPRALRMFCEDMGPTFIKFAQLVASSDGMFPDRYVKELQNCLDSVRQFPYHEVIDTLQAELGDERAAKLQGIEREPLASASIAQVHNATLEDGTEVVVKVQRPGIAGRITADVKVMRFFANLFQSLFPQAKHANPVGIVDDLDQTLHEEIDFRQEAENLDRFNQIMGELGHKDVRAPVPHWALTTERVLVMERFKGIRVDDVEAVRAMHEDTEGALVRGLRAWFQCVIFYGFFHGDVHAGNLMMLEGGDIGFLDFGIVGRFDDRQRYLVTDWMIAFATKDYKRLAQVVVEMGGAPEDVDMDRFVAGLGKVYEPMLDANFGDVNFSEVIPQLRRVARDNDMTLPREFVLITKQLIYFDRYAKLLAPELNIFKDPRLLVGMMDDIRRARAENSQSA